MSRPKEPGFSRSHAGVGTFGRPPGAGGIPLRLVAVLLLLVVVGGVTVADVESAPPSVPLGSSALDGAPIAPSDSYTSSAFCTGGAIGADGLSGNTVYLTNTSAVAVAGVVTSEVAQGTGGNGTTGSSASVRTRRRVVVPPRGTVAVDPGSGLPSGALGTSFAFDGGGIGVDQVVTGTGTTGWSTAPCASQTSGSWYFAGGSTASGNALTLDLFNPTASAAVVNVSFLTARGLIVPSSYQGLDVPAGQVVSEAVGTFVQGHQEIATMVSAQSGSIVADELQMRSTSQPGFSIRLGSPMPARAWYFGQTTDIAGGAVTFHLFNPGPGTATVTLSFGIPAARVVPIRVTLAAQSLATFVASKSRRLPRGIPYAVTVHSTNGIVVSRSVRAAPGTAPPGWGGTSGTTTAARQWLVLPPGTTAAPGTAGATVSSLGVSNPGSLPARVVVVAARSGAAVASIDVAPGSIAVLGAATVDGLRPFIVRADQPVVVEEDSGPNGAPGIVASAGLPFWP